MQKSAMDPLMLGLGAAATGLTTWLTAKQIKGQKELTRAVEETRSEASRAIRAAKASGRRTALATGAAGLLAGALAMKHLKAKGEAAVPEPKAAADVAAHREYLRKLVSPVVGKKKGSDIETDTLLGSDASTPGR